LTSAIFWAGADELFPAGAAETLPTSFFNPALITLLLSLILLLLLLYHLFYHLYYCLYTSCRGLSLNASINYFNFASSTLTPTETKTSLTFSEVIF
jgi:hypothetical protein